MVKCQYDCKFCEILFDENLGFKKHTKECTEICQDHYKFCDNVFDENRGFKKHTKESQECQDQCKLCDIFVIYLRRT